MTAPRGRPRKEDDIIKGRRGGESVWEGRGCSVREGEFGGENGVARLAGLAGGRWRAGLDNAQSVQQPARAIAREFQRGAVQRDERAAKPIDRAEIDANIAVAWHEVSKIFLASPPSRRLATVTTRVRNSAPGAAELVRAAV